MAKVIGIIGSRRRNTADDEAATEQAFLDVFAPGDTLVSGGCPKGGDRFCERLALIHKVPIMIHHADWENLGRSAGFARNTYIARDADVLIAVVAADRKGGTEDTIRKFQKLHPDGQVILV